VNRIDEGVQQTTADGLDRSDKSALHGALRVFRGPGALTFALRIDPLVDDRRR